MIKNLLLSTICLLVSALAFSQENVTVTGKVLDENKQPLIGASIMAKGSTVGTVTDVDGNFTLTVPKETKALVVSYVGYQNSEVAMSSVQAGTPLKVNLAPAANEMDQVVVSASKKKEKLLDAPASISVVTADKLERNIVTTPVDQLKTTPGVDVMRTGLISSNVVIRGFNNIFSGSVLNVIDNRIGAVPSLRVNAYQLVPTSSLDMERIEVVRGPASALYGPNASSGVVHIITKSPLDQQKKFETTIAMTGGFTVLDNKNKDFAGKTFADYNGGSVISGNIINPEFRHSGKLWGGKFGYKISGSYFQGQDYPTHDVREPRDGDTIIIGSVHNGQIFVADTLPRRATDTTTRYDTRVFKKDFFIRKWNADARIDIRPIKDITITINGGVASSHNVELTGLGAGQAGGTGSWIYWYLQARFKWKNLYVQYFVNSSDAGNTYLIPQISSTATQPYPVQLLIDKSKLHGIQIQHSWNPIEKLGLVYGGDALLTRPNTEGTINGRFENIDNLNQLGLYIQGDYDPLKWLKLVAAFRVDYNSIIKNVSFSPRAGLVFKPAVGHNIRITYNRAFDSPTTLNQFLDLSNGLIPNGINIRGIGNPYGWSYNFDPSQANAENSSGVQFITAPYGGTGQWYTFGNTAANAPMLDSLKGLLIKQFTPTAGVAAPALVNAIFQNISGPTGSVANAKQLAIDYANFATTGDLNGSKISNVGTSFQNLKKINNSTTQTLELGYKGLIAGKLSISVDGYWTRISDYVSALKSASGAVVLDHNTYLGGVNADGTPDTNGLLWQNLYKNSGQLNNLLKGALDGQPSLQDPAIVKPIAGSIWDELVVLSYKFPIGNITPNDSRYVGSDYILTYQNLGRLDVFGLDFGFQYNIYSDNRHDVSAGGSLDWVDKDQLKLSSGESVPLNAPKLKASVTFDHTLKNIGLSYGLSFRYQMGYEASSAVYSGTVKPAYLLDARISYKPNFYKNLILSINVNNVANYQWSSFPYYPGNTTTGLAANPGTLMGTQFFARAQVTF